jgi:hypothetical protein
VTWRIPPKREDLKTETGNVYVSDSVVQSPMMLDLAGENGAKMVQLDEQWAGKY